MIVLKEGEFRKLKGKLTKYDLERKEAEIEVNLNSGEKKQLRLKYGEFSKLSEN